MKDEEKNEGTGISNPRLQKRDSDRGATSAVAAVVDRGRAGERNGSPTPSTARTEKDFQSWCVPPNTGWNKLETKSVIAEL